MAEEKKKKEKKIRKVLYLGKDSTYFVNLQEKYQELYEKAKFLFQEFFEEEQNKIVNIIPQIIEFSPNIILVDYSIHKNEMVELARILLHDIFPKKVAVVGLLENIEVKEVLRYSLLSGVTLNIIKGTETITPVHHSMTIAYPHFAKDTEFSVAQRITPLNALTPHRMLFMNEKYMRLESNFQFDKGTPVKIESKLGITPDLSHNYLASGEYDYELYSECSKAFDLKFDHMDAKEIDFIAAKIDVLENRIEQKPKELKKIEYELEERNDELMQAVEKANEEAQERPVGLQAWLNENQSDFKLPISRVLIIDSTMECLKNMSEELSELSFLLKFKTTIDDESNVIYKFRPAIVAINMDYEIEHGNEEIEKERDELFKEKLASFKVIINQILKIDGFNPVVMIFNYKRSHADLKKYLDYSSLMLTTNLFDFELVKKCVDVLEKKRRFESQDTDMEAKTEAQNVYFAKNNPICRVCYNTPIKLTSLSEIDATFKSEFKIPFYTCIHTEEPVETYLTIVPVKEKSKRIPEEGEYYALVNGLGEVETSDLRKYVNDLIFEDEGASKTESQG